MSFQRPTAAEIDGKMREDFRRRLKDFGYSTENTDPILSVLFRTFAGQVEKLYAESERIREALLDELISGLGMEQRMARAAQTVVRLVSEHESLLVDGGTELLGESQSGERLAFSTDVPIQVSTARLAFVLAYQKGNIRVLPGLELDEDIEIGRPALDPVPVNLGPLPALFLAIDNLPESHLTRHGFFFDLSPFAPVLQRCLLEENWCVAQGDGTFSAAGLLRPRRGNAGVRMLEWLIPEKDDAAAESKSSQIASLPNGFYAGRTFLMPRFAPSRRTTCKIPRALETVLPRLFTARTDTLFDRERAWIRIGFPSEIESFESSVANILLHAVSASNIECFNQTIYFAKHGTSIPISAEAGTHSHLVAPVSILSESGRPYVHEFMPAEEEGVGRYVIRNGRIQLTPAASASHVADTYANLRLWITAGTRGNEVSPGSVRSFLRTGSAAGLRINNITAAAGGTDGESYQDAHTRFAHILLSRERIITREDLLRSVRGFDRRILWCKVDYELIRTYSGLMRVHVITIRLRQTDFVDYAAESHILREDLTNYLAGRSLFDIPVDLRVETVA